MDARTQATTNPGCLQSKGNRGLFGAWGVSFRNILLKPTVERKIRKRGRNQPNADATMAAWMPITQAAATIPRSSRLPKSENMILLLELSVVNGVCDVVQRSARL